MFNILPLATLSPALFFPTLTFVLSPHPLSLFLALDLFSLSLPCLFQEAQVVAATNLAHTTGL